MARPKDSTTAPASSTKAVANWDEDLAKFARDERAIEPTKGGAFISTKGGKFTVDGVEVPGTTLDLVILDWIFENHLYTDAFDPDTPATPTCYALGRVEKDMAPHDGAETPQCGQCGTPGQPGCCPANEWNSGLGKGKACKNYRRLATIAMSDFLLGPEGIAKAEVRILKISPSGIKAWSGYIGSLSDELKRPSWTVGTQVSLEPIPQRSGHTTKFAVLEDTLEKFTPAVLQALKDKRAKVGELLMTPYAKAADLPQKAVPVKGAKFQPKGVAAKPGKFVPKAAGKK